MGKYFSKERTESIERELSIALDDFLIDYFGITIFDYPDFELKLNSRFRRKAGLYRCYRNGGPISIEISAEIVKYNSREAVLDILRHEGIHMALHVLGKPFGDDDQTFIQECKRLGVTLTGTTVYKEEAHRWSCPACGKHYHTSYIARKGKFYCNKHADTVYLEYDKKVVI